MDWVFKLLLLLISVLGSVTVIYVVPYIKSKIKTENLEQYAIWTDYAVRCAEMIWKESGRGTIKKEYVKKFLNDMFNSKDTILTEQQIDVLIESAVKELRLIEESGRNE